MSTVFIRLYPHGQYSRKEIYRYLGASKPEPELKELVEKCIKECDGVFKYSVCFTESELKSENDILHFETFDTQSAALSKNLSGCKKVVIFAATVGLGIDRLISKYAAVSPSKAIIFQAIGAERIEYLCDLFSEDIKKEYEKDGFLFKPRFSPGYADLSLKVQTDIFSLLECQKRIGLTLSDSLLMLPSKSVSAFIGIYGK